MAAIELVREIWKDLLGRADMVDASSFFELGGDSILAMSLLLRIEERLGVAMEIHDVFDYPELSSFAARVDILRAQIA